MEQNQNILAVVCHRMGIVHGRKGGSMINLLPIGCGTILGAIISEAIISYHEGYVTNGLIATFKALGWLLVTTGLIALKNA